MTKHSNRRSAPKKPRAIQTSRHLHVAHRKHTGHVLPRRSTSYPVLTMIVLCVGVLLFSWTVAVTADSASYTVNASVPGPAPTVAATIDSPTDGSHFTATPITVNGSCPLNTYVALSRNGFSSGVALCDATGRYSLVTDLFSGLNQLVARVYSPTDVPGPDSATVSVTYTAPVVSGGSQTQGGSSGPYNPSSTTAAGLPEPLLIKANYSFRGYYTGQPASWQIRVEGGNAPYAIEAEWGDGSRQLYSRAQAGNVSLQHVYRVAGGYRGSYIVKVTATDASGAQTVVQLLAIISNPPKTVSSAAGSSSGGSGNLLSGQSLQHLVGLTWTGYGIVLLMLVSFWLGERREAGYFRPLVTKRRHAH